MPTRENEQDTRIAARATFQESDQPVEAFGGLHVQMFKSHGWHCAGVATVHSGLPTSSKESIPHFMRLCYTEDNCLPMPAAVLHERRSAMALFTTKKLVIYTKKDGSLTVKKKPKPKPKKK